MLTRLYNELMTKSRESLREEKEEQLSEFLKLLQSRYGDVVKRVLSTTKNGDCGVLLIAVGLDMGIASQIAVDMRLAFRKLKGVAVNIRKEYDLLIDADLPEDFDDFPLIGYTVRTVIPHSSHGQTNVF